MPRKKKFNRGQLKSMVDAGFTQAAIADEMGTSQQYVGKMISQMKGEGVRGISQDVPTFAYALSVNYAEVVKADFDRCRNGYIGLYEFSKNPVFEHITALGIVKETLQRCFANVDTIEKLFDAASDYRNRTGVREMYEGANDSEK